MKRYINNILTKILTLTLLLFAGANLAWGQVTDGYYYIANYKSYNASDHTKSYYICPAINPSNTSQAEYYDTDMPFLTTFKTNQNDESLWLIKWVKDEGGKKYYNIIHAKDGYYLVYNPVVTPSNDSRLRVHIQFTSTNDDNALFEVKSVQNQSYYYIHPKNDISRSLNPSKGNKDSYVALDNPVDGRNVGGMIGLWEDNEDGRWYLETPSSSVTVMPVVTNNFDGTITITATEGKIYYATSRTAPTIALTANDSPAVINLTDEITVIRAIAKTDEKEQSAMANYVLPKCVTPVVTESEGYITIECAAPNATIYYTTDGSDPSTSNTRKTYLGTFQIPESSPAVRVVAKSPGYTISEESYYTHPALVHSSTAMTIMNGNYILAPDFVLSGSIGTESTPFEGIIDGQLVTLQNKFEYPLVAYAKNATIKNVIVGEVGFSVTGDAGTIVNVAQGNTYIYNCGILSGSVSGTAKTGSIVGNLQESSRVINCYSFANVSGGDWAGGIVGYNSSSSTTTEIKTMVMNCMFYGNITGGTKKSPIYGGTQIDNLANNNGLNNYNYYAYNTLTGSITNYNTALAAKEEFLVHFELYRQLLNSNRKLASWYATGSTEKATEKICKWVLDKTIAPYPILKPQAKYSSIINYGSAPLTPESTKELSVTITGVGSTTLPISDKDPGNYNYNYHKVQLPYYNDYKDDNYKDGKVVTGWMITSLSGAFTKGEGTQLYDYPNYNLADRNCTKDADGNYRVFSQGAYFNVPIGVSSITIAPKWANAVFVADEYYDVTYKNDYSNPTSVDIMGKQFPDGIKIGDETYDVYTSISAALGNSSLTGGDVYENAVVLVGNVHLNAVPSSGTKPFTLMSIDLDKDNEPDYSLIYSHYDRKEVSPIRFDFLNIIGTAMAQKPNTATSLRDVGIFKPKGWFEITNTATIHFGQFEYDYEDKTLAPLILLGGHFDQIVSNNSGEGINYTSHTEYIHVGSNVWFKEFHNGTHADKTSPTPHRPISVTGGYYGKFYLSGMYQPKVNSVTDNAVCYIDGGQFGETAGAGQEQIKGNVTWKINYADITNFYGGGINAAKAITGNITTYIDNSNVDVYCGGPKFGDMADNSKLVKTVANKCEFRRYFGAGYGGASFYRNRTRNEQKANPAWSTWTTDYTNIKGEYDSDMGIAAGFDYEYFVGSKGLIWGRLYVNYASFSKAKTYNVTSELTDCHITGDFYGGGSLGVVDGLASSTLDGCTVNGSVYGGGYSASIPTVDVMSGGFTTPPSYNSSTGMLSDGVYTVNDPYIWENVTSIENNEGTEEISGVKYIKTTESLNNLGQVKNVNLIIKGNSHIKGDLHTYDGKGKIIATQTKVGEGGVFGGGDESSVSGDTFVTVAGKAQVDGNVFGGGNKGFVSGNSTVKILDTVP